MIGDRVFEVNDRVTDFVIEGIEPREIVEILVREYTPSEIYQGLMILDATVSVWPGREDYREQDLEAYREIYDWYFSPEIMEERSNESK